jgi:hypothetical protein
MKGFANILQKAMGPLVAAIFIGSCTTASEKNTLTFNDGETPKASYGDTLDEWTKSGKVYNGIVASFQVTA